MYLIGVDIEEVKRIEEIIKLKPNPLNNLFTTSEIKYSESKSHTQTLCGIWCAKESVVKAFSRIKKLDIRSVQISHLSNGSPIVSEISGFKYEDKYKIEISISHSKKYAIASCLVYNNETLNSLDINRKNASITN